jgi:hypothetical protein
MTQLLKYKLKLLRGTVRRTLLGKAQKETVLTFNDIMAITVFLRGSECLTLTEQ